ncbi:MAG: PIG-L family deacetylase [Oscillospiraceae bacterium]|nr:PIG-L family deacetylase [Oscillospiraceae bacterium]
MAKQIRAMMIGAHPDDLDFRCGGIAVKYARAGHKVKFLAMCNGSGGHHIMSPKEISERRYKETQRVAEIAGIEYDVWMDSEDCELMADLETRKRLVREIRKFNPDVIFCSRPNDYHPDHRSASQLVQDASYVVIVPHFCPDVPAMKKAPVILHFYDHFQNPPFKADLMIDVEDAIDEKFEMQAAHESQMFEWLPYTKGTLDQVPADPEERKEWLRQPRIPRDGSLDMSMFTKNLIGSPSEYREAAAAVKFRDKLIERYGEKGKDIYFAEGFSVCEYGAPLSKEAEQELFPF